MALHSVSAPDYEGVAGIMYLRELRQSLLFAVNEEDWNAVRRLDQTCAVLIDKVISANRGDPINLVLALRELKDVYAGMIDRCQQEVSSMVV